MRVRMVDSLIAYRGSSDMVARVRSKSVGGLATVFEQAARGAENQTKFF
jgi:hypothetical protein